MQFGILAKAKISDCVKWPEAHVELKITKHLHNVAPCNESVVAGTPKLLHSLKQSVLRTTRAAQYTALHCIVLQRLKALCLQRTEKY